VARAGLLLWLVLVAVTATGCLPRIPATDRTTAPASGASGASETSDPGGVQWRFVVIRHAERTDDGTDDPALSDAGLRRSAELAGLLTAYAPGEAVYATRFRRAQQTAQAPAADWGVPVTTYDEQLSGRDLVTAIMTDHRQGTILVVGHSDTVPEVVGYLCQCPVDPIAEDDFARLFTVELGADGTILGYTGRRY
jgi:broad specificity phosphatase PhoE